MNGTITLERVHQGDEVSVYSGSDGLKYLLRPVDREYRGRRKPPVYYLLKQGAGDAKPVYVSGLFQTGTDGVLSGDYKDSLGIKRMFTVMVEDAGERVSLKPGRAGGDRKLQSTLGKSRVFQGEPVEELETSESEAVHASR